jgi:septal ring factor EnvC (AmiA/AmiB activator)
VRFASALAALVLAAAPARAGDPPPALDPHDQLTHQLAAELETLDQTISIVDDKLVEADALRERRIRAAYRILRVPLSRDASPAERMASARRRAAARLLIDRDRAERDLLADEAAQLAGARTTTVTASTQIPRLVFPESIARPAKGTISRHFGTYVHERSHATLSRRGLDFATEWHAPAVAPADGVVRYAGPIRGLDQGVILDHGDYLTVVAKLADLAIATGAQVHRGDALGRADFNRVYLEVRAKLGPGGIPIDPEPLLAD